MMVSETSMLSRTWVEQWGGGGELSENQGDMLPYDG